MRPLLVATRAPAVALLTTAHIGPRVDLPARGRVTTHLGGQLSRVAFGTGSRERSAVRGGGGARGPITEFSRASRRRLMRRLASVNRHASDAPPAFITLTYPREFSTDPAVYKPHLRAFVKRICRAFGARPVIWRLEWQKRGAPHFHLLIWDLAPDLPLAEWCLSNWYEVVGSGDRRHLAHGADVQDLRDWRRVSVYLSKYIAKIPDGDHDVDAPVGRLWGVEHSSLLVSTPVSWTVAFEAAIRIKRTMQKYARLHRRGERVASGVEVFLNEFSCGDLVRFFDQTRLPPPPGEPRPLPSRAQVW